MITTYLGATMDYTDFIAGKRSWGISRTGIDDPGEMHESLFPFQRDVVRWALRNGCAALFLDCGLGKCRISLEWARVIYERTGGNVLVLAPLAVSHQFKTESEAIDISDIVTVCRDESDVRPGINVTNYERIHLFDGDYAGVVLDESSIIKHTAQLRPALKK